jgi:uncharacterized protein
MPYYVPPTLLKSAGGNKRLAEFRWPAGKQPVRLVPVAIQTELAVGACQDAHPDLVTRKSPAYRCRMRFSQDSAASHTIHAYGDGEIIINDKSIRHSVIVTPDTIQSWAPRSLEELEPAHFAAFEAWHPEVVLVGTGRQLRFPPPQYSVELLARGIGVEIMANDAACRTFNILLSEDRQVLLALLLG